MSVVISMDGEDFELLCENSGECAPLAAQPGRFEGMRASEPPSFSDWPRIYWLGRSYMAVILARAFLAAYGYRYEVLWDNAGPEDGLSFGWCILSDYDERSHPASRASRAASR